MKNKLLLNFICSTVLCGVLGCLAVASADAAGITWGAPVTIAADTDVSTAGTLLGAYNMNGSAVALNGVTFNAGDTSSETFSLGTYFSFNFTGGAKYGAFAGTTTPYTSLSSNYQTLLTTADFSGASMSVTLNGLTVGHQYLVQIWSDDSRGFSGGYHSTVTSPGGNSVTVNEGVAVNGALGQYVIGTFAASAATQAFTLSGSSVINVLNAIQLRDVTPPTATWTGNIDGTWDTSSLNWTVSGGAAAYVDGDNVVFDDTATGTTTLNNAATVSPFTMTVNNTSKAYSIGGSPIAGITSLTKQGSNSLTLTGANTFTGPISISAGSLTIDGAGQLGGGSYAGTIGNNGTFSYNSSATQSLSGAISGTGALVKNGAGTLTLGASNTYTGATTVNTGTLVVAGSIQPSSTLSVASGATVEVSGTTYNQLPTGAGTSWAVAGIVNITGAADVLSLPATVTLNGGTLTSTTSGGATYGSYHAFGNTITATGTGNTISSVDFGIAGGYTLTLGTPLAGDILTASTVFKNVAGPGTLIKTGNGTLALSGANTYTGATTVNAGTLLVNGSLAAGTAVSVATGATLGGTGTVNGLVGLASGGTLSPGAGGTGTLTCNANLTLSGTVSFTIHKAGAVFDNTKLDGFGGVTFGGNLTVTATGDTLALGDSFQLFVPDSVLSGSFASFTLPSLPTGLSWDTSTLSVDGKITVVDYVGTPNFNPAAGGYLGAQSVTITSDSGSTIYYTTDGSTPSTSSSSGTSGAFVVTVPVSSTNFTIKAFAHKAGQADSPVATAIYNTLTTALWNVNDDGNWSDTTKWLYGAIPNGSGVAADFSVIPQTDNATVRLDSNRTIGSMTFGNTNNFNWTLSTANNSVLTLDAGSGTPDIHVIDNTTTITVALAGSQGLNKTGNGTLTLNSITNSYTGTTTVSAGTLKLNLLGRSNDVRFGLGSYDVASAGTLELNNPDTVQDYFTHCVVPVAGTVFTGSGTITKTGTGIVDIFTGASINGFTGLVDVKEGILADQSSDWMAGMMSLNVDAGAYFDLRTSNVAVNRLTGGGTIACSWSGSQILTVGAQGGSSNFAGIIQNTITASGGTSPGGTIALIKSGAGTLTLGGTNTYTGPTTVSQGTLALSAAGSISNTPLIDIKAGASLDVSAVPGGIAPLGATQTITGNGAVTGTVAVFGTYSAHVDSSGTPSAEKITVSGAVALQTGALLQLNDLAAVPVSLPGGTTLSILSCGTLTGTFAGLNDGATITAGPNTFVIHYNPTSVTLVKGGNYASWASTHGITGEASSLDHDNDGLNNGVEYALGLDPTQPDGSPGTLTAGVLSFTKGADAIANGDVTYVIEESDDLGLTDPWAAVVTQTPPNASATIFHTLPTGKPMVFSRLKISIQ